MMMCVCVCSLRSSFIMAEHPELWDDFATFYVEHLEAITNVMDVELQYMAHTKEAKKAVVVAGAGPGLGAIQVRKQIKDDVQLYVGDISPQMVEISKSVFVKHGIDIQCQDTKTDIQVLDNIDMALPDGCCDRYLANLSWMFVPDTQKQADEAFRLLDEEGIAAFSVWGRKERCNYITIPLELAKEFDVPTPEAFKSFQLGDPEVPTKLLKQAGFQRVNTWYHSVPLAMYSGAEFMDLISRMPIWKPVYASLGDKVADFNRRLEEEAQKVLDVEKVIEFDNLGIVAYK